MAERIEMTSNRDIAFSAMRRGWIGGGNLPNPAIGASIYGIAVDSMTRDELLIALGWSLSQNARLMDKQAIGVTGR